MNINKNDCFPSVEFYVLGDDGPKPISSSDLFNEKSALGRCAWSFHTNLLK